AGARCPVERAAPAAALDARDLARLIHIVTDAEAAMWDAFRGGPGILVIAGTGSVVWGTGVDGRTLRVGGWGHLLGDEGSGYALGLAALRELARTADGWSDAHVLAGLLLPAMGIDNFDKLVRWTTAASKREIAALAPIVLDADDPAARRVVVQAAAELAEQIGTAARLLEPWTAAGVPLALSGGLIAPERPFRAHLLAALASHSDAFRPLPHAVDGARGAALLARAQAGRLRAAWRSGRPCPVRPWNARATLLRAQPPRSGDVEEISGDHGSKRVAPASPRGKALGARVGLGRDGVVRRQDTAREGRLRPLAAVPHAEG
ncbi:MAG: hypothetical protein FIB01_16480, partial [Gemmatimonadetes bacterium]|nr:hypothetical protein [Gemmatimonadota bacterium]